VRDELRVTPLPPLRLAGFEDEVVLYEVAP
jgi:hypothetical protein